MSNRTWITRLPRIGYTPDIFLPALGGVILDANPGALGFQHFFPLVTVLSTLGLVAAFIVYRRLQCGPGDSRQDT